MAANLLPARAAAFVGSAGVPGGAAAPRCSERLCRARGRRLARPRGRALSGAFLGAAPRAAARGRAARTVARLSSFSPAGDTSDAMRDVPEPVLRAVERLARQPRVTVADVAAAAGVAVPVAQESLVSLASVTGAAIDVSDEGELAYRFPRNVRQVLQQRSVRAAVRMAWDKAFPVLFTAVRVGFGVFLILSIVVTFLAIAALSTAGKGDSEGENRRGGGGIYLGPRLFGPDIFDVMFYSRRIGYARDPGERQLPKGDGRMSFLEAVFSFVFGDGDPNTDLLGARRWRKIAAVIRSNNGCVAAEQVAPFLDLPAGYSPGSASRATNVDESFMLPVLQRFHGHPEVTDEGDLVYVFPEFGVTGSVTGGIGAMDVVGSGSTTAIRESELELTGATGRQKFFAGGLGALNFVGVAFLGSLLSQVVPTTVDSAALLSFVRAIFPALSIYAVTFLLVPLVRWFRQKRVNEGIRQRNQARARASLALARPDARLRSKLAAAEGMKVGARVVDSEGVMYSSDRDALDQPGLERQATRDFDKKLSERVGKDE